MKAFAARFYEEMLDQKDRLFLWLPVAFGLGIILYFCLPVEPGLMLAILPVPLTIGLLVFSWKRQHDGPKFFLIYILACALFAGASGFAASKVASIVYGTPILEKPLKATRIAGTIESIENLGGKEGSRVVLTGLTIEKVAAEDTPRKVRMRIRKDAGLEAGQQIAFLGKLDPTSPPVLPGSYDFQRHLYFQGIGGVGFAYTQAELIEPKPGSGFLNLFEHLRAKIYRSVEASTGPVTAGIMTALITGQRGAIAEADEEAMRESGLYHLLSISGAHVGMVSALLFFVSRLLMASWPWFALHYPIKKIAAGIAMAGAVFYCILAGADVPAQRAVLMTGLVLLAIMLDRSPFSLRLIAFAALVVLVLIPQSLIGVSFQMSFAAVAALICFFDYIEPVWRRFYSRAGIIRKIILYMVGLFLTSIIAGGMTGLLSLYHFQQFVIYGVLANMIAVPITGIVIMPAAVLALILMPFGLEGFALQIMEWGTIWMLAVAHWTAGLDGAVVHVAQWPQTTFAFLCVGMVLFLLWRGWAGKGIAAGLILFGLLLSVFHKQPDIMVSDGAELIAVRSEDGYLCFSSTRKDKFVAENWMRLAGREGERPKSFADESFPHLCDEHGCRIVRGEQKIALSFDHAAWQEDCAWANLLIAQVPVQKHYCSKEAQIYDLFDFKRHHAHAYYLNGHDIRVRSVGAERGKRPWTK